MGNKQLKEPYTDRIIHSFSKQSEKKHQNSPSNRGIIQCKIEKSLLFNYG